jgi:hypothetical protein
MAPQTQWLVLRNPRFALRPRPSFRPRVGVLLTDLSGKFLTEGRSAAFRRPACCYAASYVLDRAQAALLDRLGLQLPQRLRIRLPWYQILCEFSNPSS